MRDHFYLFAYGTLAAPGVDLLEGCRQAGEGTIQGTLYDIGPYPALLLGGDDPVSGTIWRCPTTLLPALDRYEGTADGLFRRVGIQVGDYPCWVYVAGPRLGDRLVPEARVPSPPPTEPLG